MQLQEVHSGQEYWS